MKSRICLLSFIFLLAAHMSMAADEKKAPPVPGLRADEEAIVKLTNAERAKEGLPPLKINATLCKVARAHSANMLKQGKMDHVLGGKSWADRATAGGYHFEVIGENLGRTDPGATNEAMTKWWMGSPLHKENILQKEFIETGVGIVETEKGERYFTQMFGAPYKK